MRTQKDRPVNVLMLVENNPYPFDRRVLQMAQSLTSAGYRVTVVCPREGRQPWVETLDGVKVHRFPAPPDGHGVMGYIIEYVYGTAWLLMYATLLSLRHRYDVVQAYNPPDTVFLLGVLARLTGKRFVFDHRDPSPELYESKFGGKRGLMHRLLVWLERACCTQADLVFAVNESCRRLVVARHGLPPSKVVVVRMNPALHIFQGDEVDRELRRQAPFIIGYMGHISTQDGVDYLLRALRHLKEGLGRDDFYAVIIGPADNPAELQRLVIDLGLTDKVRFTGKLPFGETLLRQLRAADVCVEPAPSSPINNISTMVKMMEYMALGKPVVAFDLPEHRVSAGDAALYTTPNDEAELAANIARLMDSADLRARLGAEGQVRVRDQFNWSKSADHMLSAYKKALGSSGEHARIESASGL